MGYPWGKLVQLRGVTLEWRRPHPLLPAATDLSGVVWIDPSVDEVELRCLLTHELIHLERDDRGCQSPSVERAVRAEAARRLIPLPDLARHLPWARALPELADDLCVTPMVARDRLDNLSPAELEQLSRLELQHT